jgi:hypothetical protein
MFFCQVITLIEAMRERVNGEGKTRFSILVTFSIMTMMLEKHTHEVLILIRHQLEKQHDFFLWGRGRGRAFSVKTQHFIYDVTHSISKQLPQKCFNMRQKPTIEGSDKKQEKFQADVHIAINKVCR